MPNFGGLSARQFLRRHWQKKPLFVPQALPGFENFIDRSRAISLARTEDVESRLVVRRGNRWWLEHGPFPRSRFADLPTENWTLLIHGLNLHLAEADALLRRFSFIPYFRLDDVMVSYAVPGGGVGAHFDSYDVFLVQGKGARLWQIGGADTALVPGAPLKRLKRFAPDRELVLEPGDMLYLPPRIPHNGVARTECVTYSVGFRAPSAQELAAHFLRYLEDALNVDGEYKDPELKTQREPARISDASLAKAQRMIAKIKWSSRDVERFFGKFLTEPKPHVFFSPPLKAMPLASFSEHCRRWGVALDLKTQMLYRNRTVFINGETAASSDALVELANRRCLRGRLDKQSRDVLYAWYLAGYVRPKERSDAKTD